VVCAGVPNGTIQQRQAPASPPEEETPRRPVALRTVAHTQVAIGATIVNPSERKIAARGVATWFVRSRPRNLMTLQAVKLKGEIGGGGYNAPLSSLTS